MGYTVHEVTKSRTQLKQLGTNTVPADSRGVNAWPEALGKSVSELEPGSFSWPVSMGLSLPLPIPKGAGEERSRRPRSRKDQPKFDGAPMVLTC